MKTLQVYQFLKDKVHFICSKLNLSKFEKSTGRKMIISIPDIITLALYKQTQGIATKKSIWNDFKKTLKCSYKTLVVNINRFFLLALLILKIILGANSKNSHPVKFTDSTDIPVCLNKNASHHKTMRALSAWSKTGKGLFYGLKLHLSGDCAGRVLALKLTQGNSDDRSVFRRMNEKLRGLFVADAGYMSEKLERDFFVEGERLLITGVRKNMKKLATTAHIALLNLRM